MSRTGTGVPSLSTARLRGSTHAVEAGRLAPDDLLQRGVVQGLRLLGADRLDHEEPPDAEAGQLLWPIAADEVSHGGARRWDPRVRELVRYAGVASTGWEQDVAAEEERCGVVDEVAVDHGRPQVLAPRQGDDGSRIGRDRRLGPAPTPRGAAPAPGDHRTRRTPSRPRRSMHPGRRRQGAPHDPYPSWTRPWPRPGRATPGRAGGAGVPRAAGYRGSSTRGRRTSGRRPARRWRSRRPDRRRRAPCSAGRAPVGAGGCLGSRAPRGTRRRAGPRGPPRPPRSRATRSPVPSRGATGRERQGPGCRTPPLPRDRRPGRPRRPAPGPATEAARRAMPRRRGPPAGLCRRRSRRRWPRTRRSRR